MAGKERRVRDGTQINFRASAATVELLKSLQPVASQRLAGFSAVGRTVSVAELVHLALQALKREYDASPADSPKPAGAPPTAS